ncbi:hypothetical protein [Rhodobacter capsulatus]|uniref:hypothetical protein n=1 Tax=Rhodobacter capsulatus TaxID=1061 RepID=UPI0003D3AD12|nr:hypothetical protein [Rhodobacter capsulatus]ETD81578.1 hypothetical protein U716_10540 [Rhodobacter capsulatus B6]
MGFVLRHLLLFFLPIVLAVGLDVATAPLRRQLYQQSGVFLRDLFSNDPERVRTTLESLGQGGISLSESLDWGLRAAVVIGFLAFSRLIPKSASSHSAVNFLTTLCVGFGFAKLNGGFAGLDWVELGLCLIIGLCLAVVALTRRLTSLARPAR